MITRRGFLGGLVAAPAIVRASSLMAISPVRPERFFGLDLGAEPGFTAVLIERIESDGASWTAWLTDGSIVGPVVIPRFNMPPDTLLSYREF